MCRCITNSKMGLMEVSQAHQPKCGHNTWKNLEQTIVLFIPDHGNILICSTAKIRACFHRIFDENPWKIQLLETISDGFLPNPSEKIRKFNSRK